jgi:hypothetical protein
MIWRRWLLALSLLPIAFAAGAELSRDLAADARAVLDRPFLFLLRLPDWPAVRDFTHESDLFSTWGQMVLEGKGGGGADAARAALLRSARRSGWQIGPPDGDPSPSDLPRYGITLGSSPLSLRRSVGTRSQNPPTHYLLQVWISPDCRYLVTQFRIDSE